MIRTSRPSCLAVDSSRRGPRAAGGPRRPNAARALCEESLTVTESPSRTRGPRVPISLPVPAPSRRAGPRQARHRLARPLAPLEARQGAARACDRPDPRTCCACPPRTASASSPPPTPARSRWRCGACSAPRPVTLLAWESFGEGWVTDVVKQLKLDADRDPRRLWRAARSRRGRLVERRRLHLERHHLGRARARRRLDRRRPRGPDASPTRPPRSSPSTCRGTRSMSPPSPGRRCSAARAATAC